MKRSGCGRSACCCPMGAGVADRQAANRARKLDSRAGPSADRARRRESDLAISFRPRHRRDTRTISAAWARVRRIRNCSITWRTDLLKQVGRWKPLHREILLSNTYRQSSHSPHRSCGEGKGSRQQAAVEVLAAPPRSGRDSRCDAGGRRPAERQGRAVRASSSRSIRSW